MPCCAQLATDFWGNTTVAFLGDSINNLVSNAAECFAAQDGDAWAYDKKDAAAHVTVLNAGFNLPARLQALEEYNGAACTGGVFGSETMS